MYRAAADLLERWAAKVVLDFDFTSDSQSFRRSQKADALQKLAARYRRKQRPIALCLTRTDLAGTENTTNPLGPSSLDYMASG